MKSDLRVVAPPLKPTMIFDGDCHFCALWIKRWQQSTGDSVDYVPLQASSVAERFPEVPRTRLETAVHLIGTDGAVFTGAEAVFRSLAHRPRGQRFLRWYQSSPAFGKCADSAYRFIAEHRPFFSWLTRVGWGEHVERPTHLLTRWVVLRALGVIYLIAFLSLWAQLSALIGSNGILPAGQFMAGAERYFDTNGIGLDRYRQLPTLCWLSASDGFLNVLCATGAASSILLVIGVAPLAALILLWALYLSLAVVGQTFLNFQWDALLLEAGFFAMFVAPRCRRIGLAPESPPSRISVWLLRWLLFRLMFQSGVTKLVYHDSTWLDCTALTFHYETQPLPTWIGWYAHQLPVWFQKLSCLLMYGVEVVVPFLFFAPRRLRMASAGVTVLLMVLIGLTGNYNFFNLLTATLCIPLLDDFAPQKFLPLSLKNKFTFHTARSTLHIPRWRAWLLGAFAASVVLVTTVEMLFNCRINAPWLEPLSKVAGVVAPLRSLNSYGLFRVMTRPRYEIVIEGSNDRVTWQPYEFKWKPGDEKQRPGFVEPHQPRLDWQMWFEALRPPGSGVSPWFANFCLRLLQGSPEVLALLKANPFPEKPPRYLRATLYEYHFTTIAERRATGAWWKRALVREYLPPVSLEQTADGRR